MSLIAILKYGFPGQKFDNKLQGKIKVSGGYPIKKQLM